jgi:hypothetical protein
MIKFEVFWVVTPCSAVVLRDVGILPHHHAGSQPRRPPLVFMKVTGSHDLIRLIKKDAVDTTRDIHGTRNRQTPWIRAFLETLTVTQLVQKFSAFYGTRRFSSQEHLHGKIL